MFGRIIQSRVSVQVVKDHPGDHSFGNIPEVGSCRATRREAHRDSIGRGAGKAFRVGLLHCVCTWRDILKAEGTVECGCDFFQDFLSVRIKELDHHTADAPL